MTKHIILWKLKESLTPAEKETVKAGIRAGLEGLAGQIPGLVEIHVYTAGLPSSNVDLMLDSSWKALSMSRWYTGWPSQTTKSAPSPSSAAALILRYSSVAPPQIDF